MKNIARGFGRWRGKCDERFAVGQGPARALGQSRPPLWNRPYKMVRAGRGHGPFGGRCGQRLPSLCGRGHRVAHGPSLAAGRAAAGGPCDCGAVRAGGLPGEPPGHEPGAGVRPQRRAGAPASGPADLPQHGSHPPVRRLFRAGGGRTSAGWQHGQRPGAGAAPEPGGRKDHDPHRDECGVQRPVRHAPGRGGVLH